MISEVPANPPVQVFRLFQYGSAECDQYEIPNDDTFESRRPVEQPFFLSPNIKIHQVACGALHTLILSTTGQVYSWGCNDDGALGRATLKDSSDPLEPKEGENFEAPKNNNGDSPKPVQNLAAPVDANTSGQHKGQILDIKENAPGLVVLDFPVDMISAGDSHSVACNSKNGVVFMWGVYRNTIGGNMCQPHRLPIRWGEDEFRRKEIQKVLSGCNHSLILSEERVYVWGDPDTCVLGRMPLARRKLIQGLCIEALSAKQVVDVYTGGYHSFVKQKKKITKKDTKSKEEKHVILAWGLNNYGQLGLGTTENTYKLQEIETFRDIEIADIKGGEDFTIVLTKNGEVYSFGRCDDGQLGLGEDWKEKVEAQKPHSENEEKNESQPKNEIKAEKKFNFVTFPIKIAGLDKIDRIYSGSCYSYAMSREKDAVYSWGSGDHYVLGNGKEEPEMAPFTLKNTFYKLEKVIELGLGGQHVTMITSNVANGYKLFDIDASVKEIDKKLLQKSRGRKERKTSVSQSKSKSKSKSKEKSPSKEKKEIKEEKEKRNEKKRKLVENEGEAGKKELKKIKEKH